MRRAHRDLLTACGSLLFANALSGCGGGTSPGDAKGAAPQPAPVFRSDDFSESCGELASYWRTVDPAGGAGFEIVGVGSRDARLTISLPPDEPRMITPEENLAPRVLQEAADRDVSLEVKFDSPVEEGRGHGLLFEESPTRWIRFDLRGDGPAVLLSAASISDRTERVHIDRDVSVGAPHSLGVRRAGDRWTLLYANEGGRWVEAGSFTEPLALKSAGVFALTEGGADGGTTAVDYVFDSAEPVTPEDGDPKDGTFELTLSVDIVGDGEVLRDPDLEGYRCGQKVMLSAVPAPDRVFEGWSGAVTSAASVIEITVREDLELTAAFAPPPQPQIDVWYGAEQSFGEIGLPQPWVNLLGNVGGPREIESLAYSLNGGPFRSLSIGPDRRRLVDEGDFNIDLPVADLHARNTVAIRAVDVSGEVSTREVIVVLDRTSLWPLPWSVEVPEGAAVPDITQVVDGLWAVEDGGLRTLQVGYDRLLAIGDLSWTDYEVTASITIHGFDEGGFEAPSNAPIVGVGLRWQGHSDWGDHQPEIGFYPVGAYGFYRFAPDGRHRVQITGNNGGNVSRRRLLEIGRPHRFKMRVETVPEVGGRYRLKVWPRGTPEPAGWDLEKQETLADPQAGSVTLVAHHVDATFAEIAVRPLGDGGVATVGEGETTADAGSGEATATSGR